MSHAKLRTTRALTIGLSAILAVCVIMWSFAAIANAAERDSIASQFSFSSEESDPVPIDLDLDNLGASGIAADSIQLLGDYAGREIYFGTDTLGNVCLIAYEPATKSAASSCGPPGAVDRHPLGVGIWTSMSGGIEVYLLVDGSVVKERPQGWAQVSANVIAVRMDTETVGDLVVQAPNGERLTLPRQGSPDDSPRLPAERVQE